MVTYLMIITIFTVDNFHFDDYSWYSTKRTTIFSRALEYLPEILNPFLSSQVSANDNSLEIYNNNSKAALYGLFK